MNLTKEELLELKELALAYETEDSDPDDLDYIEERIEEREQNGND